MNFEHLNKYVVNNAPKLTRASLKKIKKMLIYLRSVTILNRQKLKLGKVVFIVNTFDSRFPFKPLITVKFSHQDGSTAPENQIERLYDEFS
jgi:hypothetical protein